MFKKVSTNEMIREERRRNLTILSNQIELAQEVSEREIKEIIQGQILSDLEIQLIELGGI